MQVIYNPPRGAAPQVQCALHPYPQGRRGACRLQSFPRSCTTSTMCAPSLSARTTRCRSTAILSTELRHKYNVRSIPIHKDDEVQVDCKPLLRAAPQVQCPLHPYPQGRRGAGRLQTSPQSCTTSTMSAPSLSARTTRHRSTRISPSELHLKEYSE